MTFFTLYNKYIINLPIMIENGDSEISEIVLYFLESLRDDMSSSIRILSTECTAAKNKTYETLMEKIIRKLQYRLDSGETNIVPVFEILADIDKERVCNTLETVGITIENIRIKALTLISNSIECDTFKEYGKMEKAFTSILNTYYCKILEDLYDITPEIYNDKNIHPSSPEEFIAIWKSNISNISGETRMTAKEILNDLNKISDNRACVSPLLTRISTLDNLVSKCIDSSVRFIKDTSISTENNRDGIYAVNAYCANRMTTEYINAVISIYIWYECYSFIVRLMVEECRTRDSAITEYMNILDYRLGI